VAEQRTLLGARAHGDPSRRPGRRRVRDAATAVLGTPPAVGGASYWADAAFLAAAGIPTVLFGPAGAGAHAAEEWVDVPSLGAVARTLTATARAFCA
jgi:acetylornithine deacetylase